MEDNMRKVEILLDSKWVEAHPSQIRVNDTFRMYEPDGTLVSQGGSTEHFAVSDAYVVDGVWTVNSLR